MEKNAKECAILIAEGLEAAAKTIRDYATDEQKRGMGDVAIVLSAVQEACEGSIMAIVADAAMRKKAGEPCDCSACQYNREQDAGKKERHEVSKSN